MAMAYKPSPGLICLWQKRWIARNFFQGINIPLFMAGFFGSDFGSESPVCWVMLLAVIQYPFVILGRVTRRCSSGLVGNTTIMIHKHPVTTLLMKTGATFSLINDVGTANTAVACVQLSIGTRKGT